jgi:hypothetical protein
VTALRIKFSLATNTATLQPGGHDEDEKARILVGMSVIVLVLIAVAGVCRVKRFKKRQEKDELSQLTRRLV